MRGQLQVLVDWCDERITNRDYIRGKMGSYLYMVGELRERIL